MFRSLASLARSRLPNVCAKMRGHSFQNYRLVFFFFFLSPFRHSLRGYYWGFQGDSLQSFALFYTLTLHSLRSLRFHSLQSCGCVTRSLIRSVVLTGCAAGLGQFEYYQRFAPPACNPAPRKCGRSRSLGASPAHFGFAFISLFRIRNASLRFAEFI